MVSEDLDGFLADFGVDATFNAETAKVIFDMPDLLAMNNDVISAAYTITFKSSCFPNIGYGSPIVVNGGNYKVNTVMKIDDGAFTKAEWSAA